MKHLDLFSGIGGFALAARWVGWDTIGFCENDPYCQKVLRKHWPGVPIYDDIKKVMANTSSRRLERSETQGRISVNARWGSKNCGGFATDGTTRIGPIDIITGGFPCQDISFAGKGVGIDGERSGLWTELARIIGEVRPRYAVLENVSALLNRGLDRVTGDLAEIGYDCEWHCIPASAVGAPHRRDRVWIIAYTSELHCNGSDDNSKFSMEEQSFSEFGNGSRSSNVSDSLRPISESGARRRRVWESDSAVADAEKSKVRTRFSKIQTGTRPNESERSGNSGTYVADTDSPRLAQRLKSEIGRANLWQEGETTATSSWWSVEPDVGRVAHGISKRVDRLRGLGNAIVPQVAEVIFRAIDEVT